MGGQGGGGAGALRPGRSRRTFQAILEGKVPGGPHLGRRGKEGEIEHRPGRDVTMSAPKSVSLLALVGGDARIVEAHDRAVHDDPRLGREERGPDPDAGRDDGGDGPRRRPEDGGGDLQARHLPEPRPPAPHPLRDRQHGAGRGRPLAHDGERRPLPPAEGDQRDLPRGAGRGARAAGLRHRAHPCGRALRDRRGPARGDRGVLDPAGGDRGGDEGAGLRRPGRQQAPGGPRGAHDAGRQARRGQGSACGRSGSARRNRSGSRPWRSWTGPRSASRRPRPGGRQAGRRCSQARSTSRPTRWTGRWSTCRSGRRCSPTPTCWRRRSRPEPGSATVREAEWAVEVLERDGKLHGAIGPEHGRHWATEAAVAREWETVGS